MHAMTVVAGEAGTAAVDEVADPAETGGRKHRGGNTVGLRIEDYAPDWRHRDRGARGQERVDRLVVCASIRLPAFFAALLGTDANGHWQITPVGEARRVERRYRPGTLVLETDFETDDGLVRLVDCMPLGEYNNVVRIVEGLRAGSHAWVQIRPRFDYGRLIPAIGRIDQGIFAVAGPDAVCMRTTVEMSAEGGAASAAFTISEGERVPFHLAWYPSHLPRPEPIDPFNMTARTESWWREWSGRCTYEGPHAEDVLRSLITLKALTYVPTGAIVAALTTSLPEEIGESETGTTASAGCATAHSRWRRWCIAATWTRPSPGATGSYGRSRAIRASCTSSCTASAASTG